MLPDLADIALNEQPARIFRQRLRVSQSRRLAVSRLTDLRRRAGVVLLPAHTSRYLLLLRNLIVDLVV
jgi:hypothetical protein